MDEVEFCVWTLRHALAPFSEVGARVDVRVEWVSDYHLHLLALIEGTPAIDTYRDVSGPLGAVMDDLLWAHRNDLLVLLRLHGANQQTFHRSLRPASSPPQLQTV